MLDILIFQQDTTDYVAYVAKDPVNRRGKLEIPIWKWHPLPFDKPGLFLG